MCLDEEAIELIDLARSLAARVEGNKSAFDDLVAQISRDFGRATTPIEHEHIVQKAGRELRHLWLEASASSTSRSYRSPPADQNTQTATGRSVEFGYERDLQPTYLEERCARFFSAPPKGWSVDHVLLSSGQSAMAAVLHALEGFQGKNGRKLSFIHLGSYFETAEIFSLFSSLLKCAGRGRQAVTRMGEIDADIFIIEPVFCDGEFGCADVGRLVEAHKSGPRRQRAYVFDNTLVGMNYALEEQLDRMHESNPLAVFRLISGLKLFQGGLELSNVGIVSVFAADESGNLARRIGDRLRKIRTLLGLGLSFAEVAALEAPWFLDREYTTVYQGAIFRNNAELARAVAAENRLFRGVFHPVLLSCPAGARDAPYCVFRLRDNDAQSYSVLESYLQREVSRRGILLEPGGSFGFRGHRFEVVRPEDGTEPFLRIALGRRTGWSRDESIKLMLEVARSTDVSQLGAN